MACKHGRQFCLECTDEANKIPDQLDRIEAKLDQLLTKKKPGKRKASKVEYPDWFEAMWKVYPRRAGGNPKRKALSACSARFMDSLNLYDSDLMKGVERYDAFCDATGKTGTEFVMQAATFFGPDKHYECSWELPKQKIVVPSNDNALEAFAIKHGLHEQGKAPQNIRDNYQYRQWIESKL